MSRRSTSITSSILVVVSLGFLLLTSSLGAVASGGPHEAGTLLLHTAGDVAYTTDSTDYCLRSALSSCSGAVAEAPANPDSIVVCYVLAAFPEGAMPSLSGVTFGIQYAEEDLTIVAHGSCGEFELAMSSWPANGSGTAVTWTEPRTGALSEVYWFVAYASSPTMLTLAPHPTQGAFFADDSVPSILDEVVAFGSLGFGRAGSAACPGGDSEGDDGGGETALSVFPDRIDPRAGCWTLLVTGSGVDRLVLRSDRQELEAVAVERTSPESQLFTYEGLAEEGTSWHVAAFRDGTSVLEKPLTLARLIEAPKATLNPGRVTVTAEPGVFGYPPGEESRRREDVPLSQPQLAERLAHLGVPDIMKRRPHEGEVPPPWNKQPSIPSFWRAYRLNFDERHCSWAFRELLTDQPGVERVEVSFAVKAYDQPCDAHVTDPKYELGLQWNLRHWINHGHIGIGANYAWCRGTGSGQVIGIIDFPFTEHPDVVYDGGYTLGGECGYHGMSMAATAAAVQNTTEIVGVAYDAQIWTLPIPCGGDADDIAFAFEWGRESMPSGSVFSISIATDYFTQDLLDAVANCYNADFPIFAIGHQVPSYPGEWDQNSTGSTQYVLSVAGSRMDGTTYSSNADIYAPTELICQADPLNGSTCWDNETGSHAVPQVAAAAAIGIETGSVGTTPYAPYTDLLGATSYTGVVSLTQLLGMTSINDVANVTTSGTIWGIILEWDLLDAEGVVGFSIESAPSCWGPFVSEVDFIEEGDPEYTNDGVHYVVLVPVTYDRNYALKLTAIAPNGQTADYFIEDRPHFALEVDPGSAPAVSLEFLDFVEAEVRWPGDTSGGSNETTVYWVYRSAFGELTACGEGGEAWGSWHVADVLNSTGSCPDGPTTDVCWYEPVVPGIEYRYRVAAAREDEYGEFMWMSPLSNEVGGYGVEPASIVGTADLENEPTVVVQNPARGGVVRATVHVPEAATLMLDLVDVGGRVVWHEAREFASGMSRIDLSAPLSAGVYFIRVHGSAEGVGSRVVVLR